MSNSKKLSNFFDVFKSFYYVSKFIGTVPFTITVKNNTIAIKTSYKDYIIFGIFIILYGSILYMCFSGGLTTDLINTSSDVANYANKMLVLTSILFAMGMNLINFLLKNRTIQIINDLITVDSTMKFLNLDVDYNSQSKVVNKFLIVCLFLVSCLASSSAIIFNMVSTNVKRDFTIYTVLLLNNFFYVNVVSQFILLILSVYERFRQLNQNLEDIFKFNQPKYERQDFSEVVRQISKIHDFLIEIVQKINFRFSVWIMITLAAIFVFFTFSIFSVVRAIIIFDRTKFLFSLSRFSWFLYYMLFLVMAISAGSRVTRMVISFKLY